MREKIAETVKDPETAEALQPHDHPIGTKRICVDIDYFETYNRPNVTLVDLRETPIEAITAGRRAHRRGDLSRSTPSSSPPASTP